MSAEQSLRSALLAIDEAIVRINKFMEDESQDSEVPDLFNRGKANEFLTLAKRHLDEAVQSDPNLTASIEKGERWMFYCNGRNRIYFSQEVLVLSEFGHGENMPQYEKN
ncbi:MAG: hypothetical protein AAB394_04325 [Patescibacteria group bacterium]